jgi:hypothetical protein
LPRLYCEEHGLEDEARSREDQENYRRLGETVLVVTGPLKRSGGRCDRCNARLKKGTCAYLISAFPSGSSEYFGAYDYAYEGHFLALASAKVKVYGLQPRGGLPPPGSAVEAR